MHQKQRDARQIDGEIALEAFVALSPGIGLGEPRVRPSQARSTQSQSQTPRSPQMPATPQVELAAPTAYTNSAQEWQRGAAAFPPVQAQRGAQQAPRPTSVLWGRRLLAYSLDFMVVCLTLGTALACATVWHAVQNGFDLQTEWYALPPWQWLSQFKVFEVLVGVYGVFFAYAIFFKWVVGITPGETLMRESRKSPRASSPARS